MRKCRVYSDDEKAMILAVLAANKGNVTRTARILNIARSTLREWRKIEYPLQESLTGFKSEMMSSYQHARHLAALDVALMEVTRYVESGGKEGHGRLLVEMPPRHGKTTVVSRLYPAWHLGRNPAHRVMLVSYGASLALKNSRAVRRLVRSKAYREIFNIQLARDNGAVDGWDIAGHQGGVDALGVGGAAMGKGAHLLLLDDPIKNREQAQSAVYREKIWEGYTSDLYTRLEPGGAVVVMMTRWNQDDLIGRILRQDDGWRRLRFPAVAEENDPLGRAEGEALWAARFPLETLYKIRKTLGDYAFAALYQQSPVQAEGNIFKRAWFAPLVDGPPVIVRAWRFWDLAMSERTSADYTAGVKLGRDADGGFYVLDVARGQIGWEKLADFMADVILKDGVDVVQGIEQRGYMSRAIQDLNRDLRFHRYTINGYKVDADKLTRALPFAAKVAAGVVRVLNRHWTQAYIEELCGFPHGAHDDQVDASAGVWAMAADDQEETQLTFTVERFL